MDGWTHCISLFWLKISVHMQHIWGLCNECVVLLYLRYLKKYYLKCILPNIDLVQSKCLECAISKWIKDHLQSFNDTINWSVCIHITLKVWKLRYVFLLVVCRELSLAWLRYKNDEATKETFWQAIWSVDVLWLTEHWIGYQCSEHLWSRER